MTETKSKPRLWTKYFILICCMTLFTSLVMRLLDNTLAIYANDTWGSKSAGGLLTTAFTFGSIISNALCGNIIDRLGRRKVLWAGAALFVVATIGFLFFDQMGVVLALRVLQGLGKAVVVVACASMAADVIPKERMGEGMGYYGLGNTLANAFGPALGIAMISGGNYNFMFGSCAAFYVIVMIMCCFVDYEKKQPELVSASKAQETGAPKKTYRGIWVFFEKAALPISVVTFFASAGTVCILVYLTLYATDGLGIENPGMFFTFAAVTMLLTRLVVGKMVDRHGVVVVIIPGIVLVLLTYLLLAFVAEHSYPVFLLCGALYGAGTSMFYPAIQAVTVVDSPPERKGVANSTMLFWQDFGILCASAVLGWVLEGMGYMAMFAAGSVFLVVSAVLCLILMGNGTRAKRRAKFGVE